MKELLRTNDIVLISRIQSILDDEDVQYKLFDVHASIIEGSINAIEKRILVSNYDYKFSQKLIQEQAIDIEDE